jgi:hypothetical protein
MKLGTQHLHGWLRVFIIMAVIAGVIFLLRIWSFSSPTEVSMLQGRGALPANFDLRVHYHERPPYYAKTKGGVAGLCATPVRRAFEAAGIPYQWTQTPPKRQLHLIEQKPGQDCIVGWFKTRERERYARYSTSIYQDQPMVALVRREDPRMPERCTVADLLSVPDIIMLSRPGYSYGPLVDSAVVRIAPRRMDSGVDSSEWLSILFTRRADFVFIAPEEAQYLLSRTQLPTDAFRFLTLTDMPPGNHRYVLFSRAVPPEVVDRFNAAFLAGKAAQSVSTAAGEYR